MSREMKFLYSHNRRKNLWIWGWVWGVGYRLLNPLHSVRRGLRCGVGMLLGSKREQRVGHRGVYGHLGLCVELETDNHRSVRCATMDCLHFLHCKPSPPLAHP